MEFANEVAGLTRARSQNDITRSAGQYSRKSQMTSDISDIIALLKSGKSIKNKLLILFFTDLFATLSNSK